MHISARTSKPETASIRRLATLLLVFAMALIVAGCGGDDDEDTTTTATTATTTATTETAPEETEVSGKTVFSNNCGTCHGFNGAGGNGGPNITGVDDEARVVEMVTNGGGAMPSFSGTLDEEEIAAVAEYVASLEP